MAPRITSAQVTIRPSSLFEAVLVALESDEFRQVRKKARGRKRGRCAWGVVVEIMTRASYGPTDFHRVHPRLVELERRAGRILGYDGIASANDGRVSFADIARALRQAEQELGAGPSRDGQRTMAGRI